MFNSREFLKRVDDRIEFLGDDRGRDQRRNNFHRLFAALVGLDVADRIMRFFERVDEGFPRLVRRLGAVDKRTS